MGRKNKLNWKSLADIPPQQNVLSIGGILIKEKMYIFFNLLLLPNPSASCISLL